MFDLEKVKDWREIKALLWIAFTLLNLNKSI